MILIGPLHDGLLRRQSLIADLIDQYPDLARTNVCAAECTASSEQKSPKKRVMFTVFHRKLTLIAQCQKHSHPEFTISVEKLANLW